jgi:DNA polymerase III subunit epsilon
LQSDAPSEFRMPNTPGFDYTKPWEEFTYVSFDLETSGAWPIGDEICEIAAVKWKNGEKIEEFQSLIKGTKPLSDFIIGIHGISNEMVANAPAIGSMIKPFRDFIEGSIMVAHHAPFDMGFLAYEFEKSGLSFPAPPVLCTSLLSIVLFPEYENHKLQTLVHEFKIEKRTVHRALEDSLACGAAFFKCVEKIGAGKPLKDVYQAQSSVLRWPRYSIKEVEQYEVFAPIIEAIKRGIDVEIVYGAGTSPDQTRIIKPLGIVRTLDGDFLACPGEPGSQYKHKRYYLKRISRSSLAKTLTTST